MPAIACLMAVQTEASHRHSVSGLCFDMSGFPKSEAFIQHLHNHLHIQRNSHSDADCVCWLKSSYAKWQHSLSPQGPLACALCFPGAEQRLVLHWVATRGSGKISHIHHLWLLISSVCAANFRQCALDSEKRLRHKAWCTQAGECCPETRTPLVRRLFHN